MHRFITGGKIIGNFGYIFSIGEVIGLGFHLLGIPDDGTMTLTIAFGPFYLSVGWGV